MRAGYSAGAPIRNRASACAPRLQRSGLRLHLARRPDLEAQFDSLRFHRPSLPEDPAHPAAADTHDIHAHAGGQAARSRRGDLFRPVPVRSAHSVSASTAPARDTAGLGLRPLVGGSYAPGSEAPSAPGAASDQAEKTGAAVSAIDAAGRSYPTACCSRAVPAYPRA